MKAAYTVIWKPSAVRALGEIVVRAMEQGLDASAVSSAADEIDRTLSFRPTEAGESRDANVRILPVLPLVVAFEVRNADRIVDVLRVSYLPRRRSG